MGGACCSQGAVTSTSPSAGVEKTDAPRLPLPEATKSQPSEGTKAADSPNAEAQKQPCDPPPEKAPAASKEDTKCTDEEPKLTLEQKRRQLTSADCDTPIFDTYVAPPEEWVQWRRSPAIGRFMPIREPLTEKQVKDMKGSLDALITRFNTAAGELYTVIHNGVLKSVDANNEEQLKTWLVDIDAKQAAVSLVEHDIKNALYSGLSTNQAIEVGLMCLRQQMMSLNNMPVGVGEFNWGAAVLEVNLDDAQRSKAVGALGNLAESIEGSVTRLDELAEAADRCLRYGEEEPKMVQLLGDIKVALEQEAEANKGLMAQLREGLSDRQCCTFMAWVFGVKTQDDFRPLWARRIANLQCRNPFGRYLPCFEVLSAIQVDTVEHALAAHAKQFSSAMGELVAASKALGAASDDSAITAAVAGLHEKRAAVAAADRAGLEELLALLEASQRGESAALRANLVLPRDSDKTLETPLWWASAMQEAGLTEDQNSALDAKLAELREAQEGLRPKVEAVESRLPHAVGLGEAVNELEAAEVTLQARSVELEKEMVALMQPAQQKAILLAVLQSLG